MQLANAGTETRGFDGLIDGERVVVAVAVVDLAGADLAVTTRMSASLNLMNSVSLSQPVPSGPVVRRRTGG
jgi:hypothetical protein